MTFTYDIATQIGKVRRITSDTIEADPILTDEEIEYFLTAEGSVNLAAAAAAEAIAAMYALTADTEKIGDYSYSQKIVDKMLALAKRLREKEAETPYLTWAEIDLTGETE